MDGYSISNLKLRSCEALTRKSNGRIRSGHDELTSMCNTLFYPLESPSHRAFNMGIRMFSPLGLHPFRVVLLRPYLRNPRQRYALLMVCAEEGKSSMSCIWQKMNAQYDAAVFDREHVDIHRPFDLRSLIIPGNTLRIVAH